MITVAIASRGRPLALIGVVLALSRLAANPIAVNFVVAVDDDDIETQDACHRLARELPVHTTAAPRSTLAACWNRALLAAKGAEAVTLMSDRTYPITPGWDAVLGDAIAQKPNRVLWWSSPEDGGCVVPILPKAWCAATKWQAGPDTYPFWYTDTHLQELDLMVHGGPSLKVQASYAGTRGATQSGRDFAFWHGIFQATRPGRWAQALHLAEVFGRREAFQGSSQQFTDYCAAYDAMMQERAPAFEERFGDRRPPSQAYIAAKARAEALLQEIAA